MSGIIWAIYAAGVADGISTTLSCYALLGTAAAIFYTVVASIENDEFTRPRNAICASFAIAAVLACLIPGKETFYAIAATQAGDKVLSTQTGDKAVKALNAWLDRQIAGEKK